MDRLVIFWSKGHNSQLSLFVTNDKLCVCEMGAIGNIQSFLVVGFDGETLLMAMNKMMVTVTKPGANHTCMSMTAAQDMSKVEFKYVHWDTSALTDAGSFPNWWSPEDKLLLSGASSTIASIVTLLVSLLVSTRLF